MLSSGEKIFKVIDSVKNGSFDVSLRIRIANKLMEGDKETFFHLQGKLNLEFVHTETTYCCQ